LSRGDRGRGDSFLIPFQPGPVTGSFPFQAAPGRYQLSALPPPPRGTGARQVSRSPLWVSLRTGESLSFPSINNFFFALRFFGLSPPPNTTLDTDRISFPFFPSLEGSRWFQLTELVGARDRSIVSFFRDHSGSSSRSADLSHPEISPVTTRLDLTCPLEATFSHFPPRS